MNPIRLLRILESWHLMIAGAPLFTIRVEGIAGIESGVKVNDERIYAGLAIRLPQG
jgi:hypothetical protein